MADIKGSEAADVIESMASSPHDTGKPGSYTRFASAPDTIPPVVGNFSPAVGTPITAQQATVAATAPPPQVL